MLRAEEARPVDQAVALRAEQKDLEKRIGRVLGALEESGSSPNLVRRLKVLEARQAEIEALLVSTQPVPRPEPAKVASKLAQWRKHLRGNISQARVVLQRLVVGRIKVGPAADGGCEFSAETKFDKIFAGLVDLGRPKFIAVGDRRGAEALYEDEEAERESLLAPPPPRAKGGDPGGIRTHDLHLERVACWASAPQGRDRPDPVV